MCRRRVETESAKLMTCAGPRVTHHACNEAPTALGAEAEALHCASHFDVRLKQETSLPFHNRQGNAMAMRTYRGHRELQASDFWQKLVAARAQPPTVAISMWCCKSFAVKARMTPR
jgi:hypothetical protein